MIYEYCESREHCTGCPFTDFCDAGVVRKAPSVWEDFKWLDAEIPDGTDIMTGKLPVKLDPGAYMPTRAHKADAGLDLYATEGVVVPAHGRVRIDTGVHIQFPHGTVGLLTSKSGLMYNAGITCRGTIDAGYTGSIKPVLFNHSDEDYHISRGDKITQLVILPILLPELVQVDELEETERGNKGFGSSGR